MTAPVSLAEIRTRPPSKVNSLIVMTWEERDALVELAEAYLAVRDFDPTYGSDIQKGREYADARARLDMAARGLRP